MTDFSPTYLDMVLGMLLSAPAGAELCQMDSEAPAHFSYSLTQ